MKVNLYISSSNSSVTYYNIHNSSTLSHKFISIKYNIISHRAENNKNENFLQAASSQSQGLSRASFPFLLLTNKKFIEWNKSMTCGCLKLMPDVATICRSHKFIANCEWIEKQNKIFLKFN